MTSRPTDPRRDDPKRFAKVLAVLLIILGYMALIAVIGTIGTRP